MEVLCSILCGWSMCPFGPQQWVFHGVLSSRSKCLAAWGPAVSLGDSLLRSLGNSTFRPGSFDNYSLPLVTEKNSLPLEIVGPRLSSAIKGAVCFAEGLLYPGLSVVRCVHKTIALHWFMFVVSCAHRTTWSTFVNISRMFRLLMKYVWVTFPPRTVKIM